MMGRGGWVGNIIDLILIFLWQNNYFVPCRCEGLASRPPLPPLHTKPSRDKVELGLGQPTKSTRGCI